MLDHFKTKPIPVSSLIGGYRKKKVIVRSTFAYPAVSDFTTNGTHKTTSNKQILTSQWKIRSVNILPGTLKPYIMNKNKKNFSKDTMEKYLNFRNFFFHQDGLRYSCGCFVIFLPRIFRGCTFVTHKETETPLQLASIDLY